MGQLGHKRGRVTILDLDGNYAHQELQLAFFLYLWELIIRRKRRPIIRRQTEGLHLSLYKMLGCESNKRFSTDRKMFDDKAKSYRLLVRRSSFDNLCLDKLVLKVNRSLREFSALLMAILISSSITDCQGEENDENVRNEMARLKNILTPLNSFSIKFWTNVKLNIKNKIYHFCVRTIVFYITCRLCLLCLIRFFRDKMISNWQPKIRSNLTSEQVCHLAENYRAAFAYQHDIDRMSKIEMLTRLSIILGDFAPNSIGLSNVFYTTYAIMLIIYYWFGVVKMEIIRVDLLGFLWHPCEERSRLFREMKRIKRNLEEEHSSVMVQHKNNLCFSLSSQRKGYTLVRPNKLSTSLDLLDSMVGSNIKSIVNRRLLILDAASRLVEPEHITKTSFRKLHKLLSLWGTLLGTLVSILGAVFAIHNVRIDLMNRLYIISETRRCLKNSTTFLESFNYRKLIPWQDRRTFEARMVFDRYESYSASFNYLTLEEVFYLIFHNFGTFSELVFMYVMGHLPALCYGYIYICSHVSLIIWVNQLISQLRDCVKRQEMLRTCDKYPYLCNLDIYDEQLAIEMTAAYLNYRLFVRQQKAFMKLANLLIGQALVTCPSVMFLVYLIGSSVDKNESNNPMLTTVTCIVIYINVYLSVTAVIIDKLEKIRLSILKLLASCGDNPNQMPILRNWFRNMMTVHEMRVNLAPRAFGFFVTYDIIITIDLYLAIMWYSMGSRSSVL